MNHSTTYRFYLSVAYSVHALSTVCNQNHLLSFIYWNVFVLQLENKEAKVAVNVCLILLSLLECGVAIWASAVCCNAVCCGRVNMGGVCIPNHFVGTLPTCSVQAGKV